MHRIECHLASMLKQMTSGLNPKIFRLRYLNLDFYENIQIPGE